MNFSRWQTKTHKQKAGWAASLREKTVLNGYNRLILAEKS